MFEPLTCYITKLQGNQYGKWIIDKENDGSYQHPIHIPYVQYKKVVLDFMSDVYGFIEDHKDINLYKYDDILKEAGFNQEMSENEIDVSNLNAQTVMAFIVKCVRAEKFCDGALLSSLKDGFIERLLNRLKEYDENNSCAMVRKYKVITLCGSTRFKDEFMESQKRLTLEGNIVLSVGFFDDSDDNEVLTEKTKEMLDDIHKCKIDMADEIYVINVGGYIGSSTKSEIEYAKNKGKAVHYLKNVEECFKPNVQLDDAMEKLKKRKKDVLRYIEIMRMADKPDNNDFQKKYNGFYRVRRNEAWRKEYFRLMYDFRKRDNVTFGEILLRLFQGTGQIEASFASKMLATFDDNMPIWDSNVLKMLNMKLTGNTPELKISNAVVLYDKICRWYSIFLQTNTADNMIQRFDQVFPEFKNISSTKKIDFILWASV